MDILLIPVVAALDPLTSHGPAEAWVLPEPWRSLLSIALGLLLVFARRGVTRLFADVMRALHQPFGHRHEQLGRLVFAASGTLAVLSGAVGLAGLALAT